MKILLTISFIVLLQYTFAQEKKEHPFVKNNGQWEEAIKYKATIPNGGMFLLDDRLTYAFIETDFFTYLHPNGERLPEKESFKAHSYHVKFAGCKDATLKNNFSSKDFSNFFLGNNKSKWQSNVHSYAEVTYQNLYEGIDLKMYKKHGQLKYDFLVAPNEDPSKIKMEYEGTDQIYLKNGHLYVKTSVGELIEQSPYSFQVIEGKEVWVKSEYYLKNNKVQFRFPNGYDETLPLIIDPVLTFSSYSGSSPSNFGCTATYDESGHLYGGGTVFGINYPTTTGAYSVAFNGGTIDMGITKFSPDGTQLIYSTYIGGTGNEIPHSLVVNSNDELYILGTTSSSDFPTTATAFDQAYTGGGSSSFFYPGGSSSGYGFSYNTGCDMVAVKLNIDGSSLLGSTFFGGNNIDGVNYGSKLHFNYGDAFRGEVILDDNSNCIIVSTTKSTDLPVTSNAIQASLGGESDAFLVSFNPDLSAINYCTYFGGSEYDAGYGVQLDAANNYYLTGGTISQNLSVSSNALNDSYLGGDADGFVTKISSNGNTILASTYIGTPGYDQSFFVQLDTDQDVFVVGQTDGAYPVSASVYSNTNGGQFLQKLSPDFTSSILSTTFGSGDGKPDIAISAFLVSDCGPIYVSGWGGNVNNYYYASSSSTSGLPISSDAYQSATDGQDFYLMVLETDATALQYATYFGSTSSGEHVDGGTSRFDKKGKVYQSVCAGCGGFDDFPTSPGAWSSINPSSNCNLGVFKFDLLRVQSTASTPDPYICIPNFVSFTNNSSGGNEYFWDFGDGNTSDVYEPDHVYLDTGTFEISLIVSDSTGCLLSDTNYMSLDVLYNDTTEVIVSPDSVCAGDSIQLQSFTGYSSTFEWIPASQVNDPTSPNPWVFPSLNNNAFRVVTTDLCGTDTVEVQVLMYDPGFTLEANDTVCLGDTLQLNFNGSPTSSYSWSPPATIINANTLNPSVDPILDTDYYLEITTQQGCTLFDTVSVYVTNDFPNPVLTNNTTICLGEELTINASGAHQYEYVQPVGFSDPFSPTQVVSPLADQKYVVKFTTACETKFDSLNVIVSSVQPVLDPSLTMCKGETVTITAGGGSSYSWTPTSFVDFPNNPTINTSPNQAHYLYVDVTNTDGCVATDSIYIDFFDNNYTIAPSDSICNGQSSILSATGGVSYSWSPTTNMIGSSTSSPTVSPNTSTMYYLELETPDNCIILDSQFVRVDYFPVSVITPPQVICLGESALIEASGSNVINYISPLGLANPTSHSQQVSPTEFTTYVAEYTNECGSVFDTTTVNVSIVYPNISEDTIICFSEAVTLSANGGVSFSWSPASTLTNPLSNSTLATPITATEYTVTVFDSIGCFEQLTTSVDFFRIPEVSAGNDQYITFGQEATLNGTGDARDSIFWNYHETLSCTNCEDPIVFAGETQNYTINAISPDGCIATDVVSIYLNSSIYIPNAFTPNGDGHNDYFVVKGQEISEFNLQVFDRWGLLIYESNDINTFWNGTYLGKTVQIDTYVWKVKYRDSWGIYGDLIGHVNVIK